MDVTTRNRAGIFVICISIFAAIYALVSCWLSQFWPPSAEQKNPAYGSAVFPDISMPHNLDAGPIPPCRFEKRRPSQGSELSVPLYYSRIFGRPFMMKYKSSVPNRLQTVLLLKYSFIVLIDRSIFKLFIIYWWPIPVDSVLQRAMASWWPNPD